MHADQFIPFLPTTDLERTHSFYTEALGLELARDQGTCRIYRIREGAFIGFCAAETRMSEASRTILTLVSDDVEGWHERLDSRGVATDGPPRLNDRYGIFHFFASDPEGYRVEVQRFLEPLA
jgi:predicted enzyme related to lactoylglutathione lyase